MRNSLHSQRTDREDRTFSKAIPVTSRGGPQGFETSRLPHVLNNWLTDGGVLTLRAGRTFNP
jgi:hypothetical protein